MFADAVVETVELKECNVVIQKLSRAQLRKARKAVQEEFQQGMRTMGGEIVKALYKDSPELEEAKKRVAKKPTPDEARKARYGQYDQDVVLRAGIKSWDHQTPLNGDNIDRLDEENAQKLHEAILDLSLPPLDPKELELAQVKG